MQFEISLIVPNSILQTLLKLMDVIMLAWLWNCWIDVRFQMQGQLQDIFNHDIDFEKNTTMAFQWQLFRKHS